jgi:hypothetical protein
MGKTPTPEKYHQLYGKPVSRLVYRSDDFLDYLIMCVAVVGVAMLVYGIAHPLTIVVIALNLWMVAAFGLRHGIRLRIPTLLSRPQEMLYMVVYKVRNMRAAYFIAAAVLAAEYAVIRLTPDWPHHTEWMRQAGLWMFFGHLALLTVYRTVILIAHLRASDHVKAFLMETSWRAALGRQPRIGIEIFHAYFTGLLTHIMLIAPWYFAITHFVYSAILLPLTIPLGIYIHSRFMRVVNQWFYRDHWVAHHSEFEFLYLHGPHHDAIPSGLIGVSGNGVLEGILRHTMGGPGIFYSPFVDFLIHSFDVKIDIDGHQYIPGVYPNVPKSIQIINQHSSHHFGKLEPYGLALKMDQPGVPQELIERAKLFTEEQRNSAHLDEQLNGFQWNNPRYLQYLALYDKYQDRKNVAGVVDAAVVKPAHVDQAGLAQAGVAQSGVRQEGVAQAEVGRTEPSRVEADAVG